MNYLHQQTLFLAYVTLCDTTDTMALWTKGRGLYSPPPNLRGLHTDSLDFTRTLLGLIFGRLTCQILNPSPSKV